MNGELSETIALAIYKLAKKANIKLPDSANTGYVIIGKARRHAIITRTRYNIHEILQIIPIVSCGKHTGEDGNPEYWAEVRLQNKGSVRVVRASANDGLIDPLGAVLEALIKRRPELFKAYEVKA